MDEVLFRCWGHVMYLVKTPKCPLSLYCVQVQVSVEEPIHIEHEAADSFNQDGVIYLPLVKDVRQRYTPRISGGSGHYVLYAPSNKFFEVVDGVTLQTGTQTGDGTLMVLDRQNPENNLTVTVVTAWPSSLEVPLPPALAPCTFWTGLGTGEVCGGFQ